MGKRKADNFIASDDDEEDQDFDKSESEQSPSSEEEKKPKSRKKSKVAAKNDNSDDEAKPSSKKKSPKDKPKTVKKPKFTPEGSNGDEIIIHTTSEGDKYVDLGKKKRATVRTFKGITLLDIREFYGADGDEKPGKKGISLTIDQWDALKHSTSAIDNLFADLKTKK
ncbi:hypothetical protein PILCRDRAFT_809789 [Piloderma croceum F 1598]|uniref:Transcriptional coactivator p15 (PC4) C-terminal domain-containing protein n=1 Tax=Piloderma croceum (strain F 1598) TaxID=765440 RepID=A0A0C3BZ41_PILCF|nr:hypothetical protein PILCRDRAFT_809789 [Piloderma croceum F 1598]